MIDKRTIFEIHRLKHEGYTSRAIARRLRLSRKTVGKYLQEPQPIRTRQKRKPSKLDPYRAMIKEFLADASTVAATVVLQRLQEKGFTGGVSIVRDYLRSVRGTVKSREAFIRFESAPGVQMQIDWGHFGSLTYDGNKRKLYALAVIEAHSRLLYVQFTHSQKQAALHQALLTAFGFFNGTPKELVVDNMVTAVIERQGSLIRFNEAFLDFLRPFAIVPRACNVAAPYEKGKVENAIGYLRHNFWPLRTFTDLSDVQRQATMWLNKIANCRIHHTTGERPRDRLQPQSLKPLPPLLPDCRETMDVLVHKDFAVRFDGNSYTAPPWTIGKRLTLKADHNHISLYHKHKLVAHHERSWQRKQRIELPQHKELVKKIRKQLWHDKHIAAFVSLGPAARQFLQSLPDAGQPIKKNVIRLLALKDRYGAAALLGAIDKALCFRAFGADYVENILHQSMSPANHHPPVKLKDDALNQIRLPQVNLADYDGIVLKRRKNDDDV
jgi:transposase